MDLRKWYERCNAIASNETVVRYGGNQTGRYVVVRSSRGNYWRIWEDGRQSYVSGPDGTHPKPVEVAGSDPKDKYWHQNGPEDRQC